MKPEDVKPGDKLNVMGRTIITVESVDAKAKVFHTSIGPVPFDKMFMLVKVK